MENAIKAILSKGYTGVLIIIDELSEFFSSNEENVSPDQDVLLVLSEILPRTKKLPVWTLCAGQVKLESKRSNEK